jgi:hypothetical protein
LLPRNPWRGSHSMPRSRVWFSIRVAFDIPYQLVGIISTD